MAIGSPAAGLAIQVAEFVLGLVKDVALPV
jgi:hypothetical protein